MITNHLLVKKIIEMPKRYSNKIIYETCSYVVLIKYYIEDGPGNIFIEIENDIKKLFHEDILIENYIESCYIGSHHDDKDIINNIDITDISVYEVVNKCNIDLPNFFSNWNIETVQDILENPTCKILNMKFSKLYQLLHNNHYKPNLRELFISKL